MNKSKISRRGLLAAAIAAPAGYAAGAEPLWQSKVSTAKPFDRPFRLLCAPVLTNPAPDGVTVLWATNAPSTGWVEYGETEKLGQTARGIVEGLAPFVERHMKIRIEGLKPGTKYFYRIHADYTFYEWTTGVTKNAEPAAVSEIYSFTTPNPRAAETSFTAWNDTHENVETLNALHAAHEQQPGDFLLYNGDVTNDFFAQEKMVDQMLNPAGLPFAAKVPYYFVRGNHDVRGPYARLIDQVTDVPGGKHYYTFRQGPLGAIVLDTGEDKPDSNEHYYGLVDFASFRSRQAEWLAKAIERPEIKDAPFRVLFCHIPLWWREPKHWGTYCLDGQKKWHDILVQGKIQLVMSGHTHDAHYMPADKDRPYIQLIGGGPRPQYATYARGHANGDRLKVTQYKLNGDVLHEVVIRA
jgi:acid phosphatase type 7